jgi:predicted aconitase
MKTELARHIALTAFRSSANLNDLIPLIKEHSTEDEYRKYLDAIAAVSGEIAMRILKNIYAEHPEIEGEIDRRIDAYGVLILA